MIAWYSRAKSSFSSSISCSRVTCTESELIKKSTGGAWCRTDSPLFEKVVHLLRDLEVAVRHAALVVRGQVHAHLVEADVEVRVMLLFLGDFRHAVHEIDRLAEFVEFERALDML